jgi:hypothetical protein
LTGKIRAIQRIQFGVLLPNGMNIPGGVITSEVQGQGGDSD